MTIIYTFCFGFSNVRLCSLERSWTRWMAQVATEEGGMNDEILDSKQFTVTVIPSEPMQQVFSF